MKAGTAERLKYRVIIDDDLKISADSLEEAQAFAGRNAEAHLSMRIETGIGVAASDTWEFDYGVSAWKHVTGDSSV